MDIDTTTLGPVEIDENRIIAFIAPMPGMEAGGTKFALLDFNPANPVKLLQSVEVPSVCFLVGDPGVLVPDYKVELAAETAKDLGIGDLSDAAVMIVLTVLGDEEGNTTANLKAPIVVNRRNFKAAQVILPGQTYPLRRPVGVKKA